MKGRGRWTAAAAVVFGALACSSGPDPNWPSIRRAIRETYPDVRSISIEELHDQLYEGDGEPPLLIDVRTLPEFAVSQIEGAIRWKDTGPRAVDPRRAVVVYCSVGWRSAAVADQLQRDGHPNVRNLDGSIFAWANAGYPLFREEEPATQVHGYDSSWEVLLEPELRSPMNLRPRLR